MDPKQIQWEQSAGQVSTTLELVCNSDGSVTITEHRHEGNKVENGNTFEFRNEQEALNSLKALISHGISAAE